MAASPLRPVAGPPGAVAGALREWLDAPDGPLVVRTSGSTGQPRDVELGHAAVTASATAALDRLGGPGQWLLDLPVTAVAGVQVLVRSLLADAGPVVVATEHGSFAAAVRSLTAPRCYVSLVPTQLHRLAARGDLGQLRRFAAVLVGGAALRPDLLQRCGEEGVQVVSTYGLTETCGGCVYDGAPLDSVSVRLDDAGRIEIGGPVLFTRYTGDPEGTRRARHDGWLRTFDVGRLEGGRLRVLGRVDDLVVSGGVNVSLPAVTAALYEVPGVAEAAAVAVPDDEWGALVVACLVMRPGVAVTPELDAVRAEVARSLPRTWAPRAVVRVDVLPLLPGGKIDRRALAGLTAARWDGQAGCLEG